MHCDWHTQKHICADFQAFSNTFSLYKLMLVHFLSRGVKQTAKNFTFSWFWLGKMHWISLSGVYLRFKACWIQWHGFQVSTISGSWKIKILCKNFTFCWFWLGKCIKMAGVAHIQGSRHAESNATCFKSLQ